MKKSFRGIFAAFCTALTLILCGCPPYPPSNERDFATKPVVTVTLGEDAAHSVIVKWTEVEGADTYILYRTSDTDSYYASSYCYSSGDEICMHFSSSDPFIYTDSTLESSTKATYYVTAEAYVTTDEGELHYTSNSVKKSITTQEDPLLINDYPLNLEIEAPEISHCLSLTWDAFTDADCYEVFEVTEVYSADSNADELYAARNARYTPAECEDIRVYSHMERKYLCTVTEPQAVIKGLVPEQRYMFAVRALCGEKYTKLSKTASYIVAEMKEFSLQDAYPLTNGTEDTFITSENNTVFIKFTPERGILKFVTADSNLSYTIVKKDSDSASPEIISTGNTIPVCTEDAPHYFVFADSDLSTGSSESCWYILLSLPSWKSCSITSF